MKDFRFESVTILSESQGAARRIAFAPDKTILIGANDTGKSAVIKSLYWTLGAEPHALDRRWTSVRPLSILRTRIDDVPFVFVRQGKRFAVFDGDERLIASFGSVTSELGPYLAEILGFEARVVDKRGQVITPPPAFMFLPFYVDQDRGWMSTFSSFKQLGQLPATARRRVLEYQVGISSGAEFAEEHKGAVAKREREAAHGELTVVEALRTETTERKSTLDFDLSLEDYRDHLAELEEGCSELKRVEEGLKARFTALMGEKRDLETRIAVVERAASELAQDLDLVVGLPDSAVGCPTCGQSMRTTSRSVFR